LSERFGSTEEEMKIWYTMAIDRTSSCTFYHFYLYHSFSANKMENYILQQ